MSEQKMEELKPCPFCGSAPAIFASCDHSTAWEGGCGNEGCNIQPHVWEPTKELAYEAWNRRAAPPAAPEGELVRVPKQLFLFLLGIGEIDGLSFGDRHPTIKGRYWWRRNLQECLSAAPSEQAPEVEKVIEELDALEKKATPGPWAWDQRGEKVNEWALGTAFDKNEKPIAGRFTDEDAIYDEYVCSHEAATVNYKNPEFICALRNAWPKLRAALKGEKG